MIENLIKENQHSFSKAQRRLAEYVLENLEKCGFLTAAKVAKNTGVSEATVVRFAGALGFSGYPQFQKTIREHCLLKLNSMQRMELVSEQIGNENTLKKVLKADINRIEKTSDIISEEVFSQAVDALVAADRVYVAGVRSSSALAQFASFYFNILFTNVRRITSSTAEDIPEQLIHAGEGDVVFGISFPRYSSAIVKGIEFAKKRGAKVIALTDSENSPIVKYADYVLIAKSDMNSFADSLVAPMSVINAIIYAAASRKKGEMANIFSELENIWDEYNVYD